MLIFCFTRVSWNIAWTDISSMNANFEFHIYILWYTTQVLWSSLIPKSICQASNSILLPFYYTTHPLFSAAVIWHIGRVRKNNEGKRTEKDHCNVNEDRGVKQTGSLGAHLGTLKVILMIYYKNLPTMSCIFRVPVQSSRQWTQREQ